MKKYHKARLYITGICLASCNATAAQHFTLDDCIRYAVEHATEVRKAIIDENQGRIARGEAFTAMLPKINGEVRGMYGWGRNVDPATNTYQHVATFSNNYQVYVSVPLFDGFRSIHTLRAAGVQCKMGAAARQKVADEKAIAVMQNFVDALYYRESIVLAEDRAKNSKALLQQTQRQEQLGVKAYPDVVKMQAQLAEDEYTLVHQRNRYADAVTSLKSAMNYPVGDSLSLDTCAITRTLEADSFNTDALYAKASAHHPAALYANLNVRFQKQNYATAKGAWLPSLSLSAGIATNYFRNLNTQNASKSFHRQFNDNMGQYVAATLTVPLFHASTHKAVKKARNEVYKAEIEREETLRSLHDALCKAVTDCKGCAQEVEKMRHKVLSDEVVYQQTLRKYEIGTVSVFDLHTVANTLLASRVSLLQLHMNYIIKARLIDYYAGRSLYEPIQTQKHGYKN